MKNITIIIDKLSPYHIARIQMILNYCEVKCIEVYSQSNYYDWPESITNFKKVTLFQNVTENVRRKEVWGALKNFNPDVVFVTGWSRSADLAALAWCARFGVPSVIMSDSNLHDSKRNFFVEFIKKKLLAATSGGLVAGSRSRSYLELLGINPLMIEGCYNAVDNDHFSPTISYKLKKENRFIIVARLVKKKNLSFFLKAYAKYISNAIPNGSTPWQLDIVGGGPCRNFLENQVLQLDIRKYVTFVGPKYYNEIPRLYHRSKCLILPSIVDQWGLVVNEAMAAGLPTIVSSCVGSAYDLVVDRKTGFVIEKFDVDSWSAALSDFAALDQVSYTRISKSAMEKVNDFSCKAHAESVHKLVCNVSFTNNNCKRYIAYINCILVFYSLYIIRKFALNLNIINRSEND